MSFQGPPADRHGHDSRGTVKGVTHRCRTCPRIIFIHRDYCVPCEFASQRARRKLLIPKGTK